MKELIKLLNDGWRVVKGESFGCGVNIVELVKRQETCYVVETRSTGIGVVNHIAAKKIKEF